jgi:spermidine dehydrogenase
MGKNKNEDEKLGMGVAMTRRDFLNSALLGSGTALLGAACPAQALARGPGQGGQAGGDAAKAFDGYGGVGDYANANGNTFAVVQSAHKIRDGVYQASPPHPEDTGEVYDVVIVGGGLTGLMAAHQYGKLTGGGKKVLILENHPIFGGEARQNDVEVDGVHLVGPQGSNDFMPPERGSGTQVDEFFNDFDIPREYRLQEWDASLKPLRFSQDNYSNMDGLQEELVDVAYYFGRKDGVKQPGWQLNIWNDGLARTPFNEAQRKDLLRWRADVGRTGQDDPRFLDTITYKHYLETVKGYDPMVTRFAQPMVGLLGGVGADAVSARVGHGLVMGAGHGTPHLTMSYPGGNATFARYLMSGLVPGSVGADTSFAGILTGKVDFPLLDRAGQANRVRLGATVIKVAHEGAAGQEGKVGIVYEKGGRIYRVRARAVVMASGGWVNKHILADLPDDIRQAYGEFNHAPALIANVAVHNWRFLYKLGAPAARWMDDGTMFGFSANIRRNIVAPGSNPPLHPDKPALLTFYMGLYTPGHDAHTQGVLGRTRLLNTSYAQYERQIRTQMAQMFAMVGFDPARDIAGIVLNRWGHARVIQPPGFYYGKDGKPPAREVVAKGYGRVIIAHSELNGSQNYRGAFEHGTRAAHEAYKLTA